MFLAWGFVLGWFMALLFGKSRRLWLEFVQDGGLCKAQGRHGKAIPCPCRLCARRGDGGAHVCKRCRTEL